VSGQVNAPAALPPVPLIQSGRCGDEKNLLPLPGIEPRPSSL
jgi:hypothetical protein